MKTTTNEGERIRRAIAGRASPTSQLGAELRAEATAYTRCRAAEGASQGAIAAEIGVSTVTLGRWLRDAKSAALVPGRVVAEPMERAGRFEVVTPRGLRVVGLDIDALCTLLERHG